MRVLVQSQCILTDMVNRPKAKGTGYENEVLSRLLPIFPEARRTAPGTPSCDIVAGVLPVECKHCSRWDIRDWVRKLNKQEEFWLLFVADGDRRVKDSPGEIVVMPPGLALRLLECAYS